MGSGNFIMGEDLNLQAFSTHILSVLEESGLSIHDKLQIRVKDRGHGFFKGVLVSVSGERNLENSVNESLVKVGKNFQKAYEEDETKISSFDFYQKLGVHEHQIVTSKYIPGENTEVVIAGKYQVVGTYKEDSTASAVFATLATKYLMTDLGVEIDEINKKINSLSKRFLR